MADSSKRKWFPWRRRSQALQTPRPESREVAAAQVTDKYSEYPSDGLTPVRLAEIFKEADAGDVLRQAELFEEMEEKDPTRGMLLSTTSAPVIKSVSFGTASTTPSR